VKLTELNPRWVACGFPAFVQTANNWAADLPIRRGLTFDCPHCRVQRLGVMFDPLINPENHTVKDEPKYEGQKLWTRISGETFDTLTLEPSLDTSKDGHWHGRITNGEAT
jgi:hypothetical protein